MTTLLDRLRASYRKERGHLMRRMLALDSLRPAPDVLRELCETIGVAVPAGDVFGAPDVHLDWIEDALWADDTRDARRDRSARRRTQQDTDYLVAFASGGVVHLVLVEAKADSAWTNRQMADKAARLSELFGVHGSHWPGVVPHLVLMSPRRPRLLRTDVWPAWCTAVPAGAPGHAAPAREPRHWLALPMPARASTHRSAVEGAVAPPPAPGVPAGQESAPT